MTEATPTPAAPATPESAPATTLTTPDVLATLFVEGQDPSKAKKEEPAKEAAPTPQETPKETPKEEPKEDLTSTKFAALTRKERQVREEKKAVELKMKELEKKIAEINSIETDPLAYLESKGYTYDKLTNLHLDKLEGKVTTPDPLKKLEEKLSKLEQEQLDRQVAAEKAQEEAVIDGFKNHIDGYIKENASNYELISAYGATQDVYEVIETHYAQTKKILEVKEAADLVENYLEQQALKLASVNKLKGKLGLQAASSKQVNVSGENKPVTLTNSQASAVPATTATQDLSEEEARKLAISLLKWDE